LPFRPDKGILQPPLKNTISAHSVYFGLTARRILLQYFLRKEREEGKMAKKAVVAEKTHTLLRKPGELLEAQKAVGSCPRCGRVDHWLNDVPLRAFCWGPDSNPHPAWEKVVPKPFNPYLPGYDRNAKAVLSGPIEDRTGKAGKAVAR